jgi:outer membrane protein assembly factor BamE (lipoprotein component of BamABCDE complex)
MRDKPILRSWRLLPLLLLIGFAVGCATQDKRIARYIEHNPERPSRIHSALENTQTLPGMTPKEVRLCLGSPHEIENESKENASEIWHYIQSDRDKDTNKGSDIWAMDIPQATVYFSAEGLVSEIVFYDEDEKQSAPSPSIKLTPKPKQPVSTPPLSSQSAQRERATRRAREKLPSYSPKPTELGVKGWPSIELGGILGLGPERSALLNNDVYTPGETVDGVTLTEVFSNGVLLEHQGVRMFLAPGEKTE